MPEAVPPPDAEIDIEANPRLLTLGAAIRLASSRLRLLDKSARDAPELTLRLLRTHGSRNEVAANAIGIRLSIPFSSAPRQTSFVTLTGIATRNGILKISHYVNLCAFEGERFGDAMIVRGSLERLTPVLMTALVTAFALVPLLISADAPGKELLHPVAVVIFAGLISSTLLDTLLTPVMFRLWGEKPTQRLVASKSSESFRNPFDNVSHEGVFP